VASPTEKTSTKRKVTHSQEHGFSDQVRIPNVIVMVGLPARGKTYISKKLCRYLNWIGIKTKVFNVGEYRRTEANASDAVHGANASFFSPNNAAALKVRTDSARRAMNDMADCLKSGACNVAIFDATNTTRQRRKTLNDFLLRLRCFFIESVCDDEQIIDSNITDVKVNSPDYKGLMSAEQAKEDFLKRIENYKQQYEPLDEVEDHKLSFIKVINAGRSFYVHNVQGHVQSRVVYFLMNIHLLPRSIYLTRHGESEYNAMGRIGGDSPLTLGGELYAKALSEFFEKEKISDLRIWCSQKVRAAQTAQRLNPAFHTEYWKALDEMDAGICEGLTYEDILQRYPKQAEDRLRNKYHYRYPSGESYEDVVSRLEPVIMELERQANVLVVSHQAVLRCILAYFYDRSLDELPYIDIGLHSLVKLTPRAYHCDSTLYRFDVEEGKWTSSIQQLPLCRSPRDS
uniref:6PF2K domain-containing protein n=1 Tax=Angiostrongylus cantonensis TaxID=6313 RepID=A0A0K0CZJ4_ANGCA